MRKPIPFDDCEHDWQPTEVNFQQVDTVLCSKCKRIEHRDIFYCVRYPNKRFPIDKYPLLYSEEKLKQLAEDRRLYKRVV